MNNNKTNLKSPHKEVPISTVNEKETQVESNNHAENQAKEKEEKKTMKPADTQIQTKQHLLHWGSTFPTINNCETL